MGIEYRNFTVIFPFFPRSYCDFANSFHLDFLTALHTNDLGGSLAVYEWRDCALRLAYLSCVCLVVCLLSQPVVLLGLPINNYSVFNFVNDFVTRFSHYFPCLSL